MVYDFTKLDKYKAVYIAGFNLLTSIRYPWHHFCRWKMPITSGSSAFLTMLLTVLQVSWSSLPTRYPPLPLSGRSRKRNSNCQFPGGVEGPIFLATLRKRSRTLSPALIATVLCRSVSGRVRTISYPLLILKDTGLADCRHERSFPNGKFANPPSLLDDCPLLDLTCTSSPEES